MKNAIHPCLWFNGNAFEAAEFYCSVFSNSRISVNTPMVVNFELNGQKFMGLNGSVEFAFNEAVSFVVECDTQEEIDYFWSKLTAGGSESMCGWLKDKYGVSWQIVPSILGQLMTDTSRSQRVMQAFMQMKKFDIATLLKA
ncbi:VOC family protein [Chryseotalea sanaruensis]|uniref:VOC family protein n=1 Tax=Chryseotalea sanaruensis TaxID=2482724 RepID=A0A401UES6_9BACT|nr:VOC family protein [Chryseotalea sanaruensis]GCC53411.1 VOC family protein [Chryseotalea sanaruensis]